MDYLYLLEELLVDAYQSSGFCGENAYGSAKYMLENISEKQAKQIIKKAVTEREHLSVVQEVDKMRKI
jgi:hypothetical protein